MILFKKFWNRISISHKFSMTFLMILDIICLLTLVSYGIILRLSQNIVREKEFTLRYSGLEEFDPNDQIANNIQNQLEKVALISNRLKKTITASHIDRELQKVNHTLQKEIADRKMNEIAKEKLLTELRQAQKIEAIGTMAGGIAHDFNNIIGIILGNSELAMEDLPEWSPAFYNLAEIKDASLRASNRYSPSAAGSINAWNLWRSGRPSRIH